MKWAVFDSETTVRNVGEAAIGSFAADPASPLNEMVSYGEWLDDEYEEGYGGGTPRFLVRAAEGEDHMVVMHNGPFDLRYMAKTWPELYQRALPHLFLWDTQHAEYLLSGCSEMYPSLNECCEARGLPLKDDKIAAYWDAGIQTEMIPKDELLDYQRGDVMNTLAVFRDQYNTISQDPKLMELMKVKGDDILFTTLMTDFGMKFDLVRAAKELEKLDKELAEVHNRVVGGAAAYFPDAYEFNIGSPQDVSTLLFGGTVKVVVDEPTGAIYKTGARAGQPKTRKAVVELPVAGLGLSTKGVTKLQKSWSTDDETLSKIKHPVAADILTYRGLSKDAETYFRGYSALVWPDGCIHPSYNHEATVTGRQSCSKPNLQNVTSAED